MEKDKSGNLILDNKVKADRECAELIYDVLKQSLGYMEPGQAGKNQPAENNRAKAMIDAGIMPDAEDLQYMESIPVEERIGRFLRQGHRIPLAFIREDEIEGVCKLLRTQPLDYEGFEFGPGRGERSRQADRLAGKIITLPVPEK